MKTLDYYNKNAADFVEGTIAVDFTDTQQRFTALLEPKSSILDFGCGSGRDAKAFLEAGFDVEASDGSEELCRLASEYAGITVKHMMFQELDERERYDGIWACASILHLTYEELQPVLVKMATALKRGGIIYTSFKYGEFQGEKNGRYFTYLTEESFARLIAGVAGLELEQQWITSDVRPDRGEEKWLNVILKKN